MGIVPVKWGVVEMDITELIDARAPREMGVSLAYALDDGVGQPLTAAWLELDACRAALGNTDHPALRGRLELTAALLRDAVFNLLSTTAKIRTDALAGAEVACAQGEECLPGRDKKHLFGRRFPVRERGQEHRKVKGYRSVLRARATAQ
jgi:hypothetical protein